MNEKAMENGLLGDGIMKDWERAILDAWDMVEEQDPDISTERLFVMVEDITGRDTGDIAENLAKYRCSSQD